jgi:hypothetical protein
MSAPLAPIFPAGMTEAVLPGPAGPLFPDDHPLGGLEGTTSIDEGLSLQQPDIFPVPGAFEFNWHGQILAQANGTVTQFASPIGLGLLTINQGFWGRVTGITFQVDDTTEWAGTLFFDLQINGFTIGGYDGLVLFPQTASVVAQGYSANIRIAPGNVQTITARSHNATGAALTVVGVIISGWSWSDAAGKQWIAQGIP